MMGRNFGKMAVISISLALIGCAHRFGATEDSSSFTNNLRGNRAPSSEKIADMSVSPAPTSENLKASATYHFAMAQAYSVEGNPDRAIEEYKLVLMYDPGSSLVYARLATEYIKKGMLSQAMEICKEAIKIDPKSIDARMIIASLYSNSRQDDVAITQYDSVLKLDPTHEEAAVYRAQSLLDLSKTGEAVKGLENFVKKNTESALGWYYLGRAYHQNNRYKDAEKAFNQALDLRRNFTQASLSMGFMFEETGKTDQAIKIYKELYDDAQDVTAASRLATIYLKKEKYQEAVHYLEAIENSDPNDLNNRVKLGLVYMELKKFDKAISTLEALLEKNPDSDRLNFYLGSLHEELKNHDKAIFYLGRVPESSKLFVDATLHVANLLKADGKGEAAKEYLRQSIVKSPQIPQLYVFLASIEEEEKNVVAAVSTLERAYARFPEDEKVLYYLGSLYDRQGAVDRAVVKMKQLVFVNPKNVDALNYLGYTWTVQGKNLDQAGEYLKLAMKLRPGNAYITDSWGWYLYTTGKVREAIVQLEKAVQIKGDESTILEHLGDAYSRANLQEKAVMMYQKAATYSEDGDAREKIVAKIEFIRSVLVKNGRVRNATETARSPASITLPTAEPQK